MKNRNKGCLIAVIALPFVVWALLAFVMHTSDPTIKKHLKSVEWLPSGASDVSYYERKGFGWIKIYECSIAEDEFRTLAKQNGWTLEEKMNVNVSFRRYLGEKPLKDFDGLQIDEVTRSLFFEKRQPNGGGWTVVYDRDLKKLFYSSSHR